MNSGEDHFSYALRIGLYVVCAVLPFAALLLGRIGGEQAVASVLALFAAIGPVVAMTQARKEEGVKRDAYAVGLETGLTVDTGSPGRHRLDERGA